MTPEQFTALAQLLRLRDGPSCMAARLVLVDGMAQAIAAELVGITQPSVSAAVASVRRGMALARVAAGVDGGEATQ